MTIASQTLFFRPLFSATLFAASSLILLPTASAVAQEAETAPESEVEAAIFSAEPRDQIIERCFQWLEANAQEGTADRWLEYVEANPSLTATEYIIHALRLGNEEFDQFARSVEVANPVELNRLLETEALDDLEPWLAANARLWFADALVQKNLLEEALEQLQFIEPTELSDPASYFFLKSVCAHHLLLRPETENALEMLLTKCDPLPVRYRMLGELMEQDLKRWKEKSLDEVSRMMRDVERRLDIGRGGQKVQRVEQKIIESLDELIAKLEQQAGGGGGSGSGQSQSNQSNSPAQDSSVKGTTAPGDVDEKNLGNKDGWGKLPPKDQAKAKQILGTLFPPHYQRAIEAYNKKAAQRGSNNQP